MSFCDQFHSKQLEKAQRAAKEAKELQEFHKSQVAERTARARAERGDQLNYTKTNMDLLKVQYKLYIHTHTQYK